MFQSTQGRYSVVEEKKGHLLTDGLETVLDNLAQILRLKPSAQQERTRLVAYLEQNRARMQYGSFKNRGLLFPLG